jgi:hypothetical protein
MYISSNVVLKGDAWAETIYKLKPIVDTFYDIYILSVSIGIFADKQIDSLDMTSHPDSKFEINAAKFHHNNQTLDLLFKSAIITTTNINFSEEIRMQLAFNDDFESEETKGFNHMTFLTKFANYGVTQLSQKLTDDPLENVEALNKYIIECSDGLNFEEFELEELDIEEM